MTALNHGERRQTGGDAVNPLEAVAAEPAGRGRGSSGAVRHVRPRSLLDRRKGANRRNVSPVQSRDGSENWNTDGAVRFGSRLLRRGTPVPDRSRRRPERHRPRAHAPGMPRIADVESRFGRASRRSAATRLGYGGQARGSPERAQGPDGNRGPRSEKSTGVTDRSESVRRVWPGTFEPRSAPALRPSGARVDVCGAREQRAPLGRVLVRADRATEQDFERDIAELRDVLTRRSVAHPRRSR